MGMVPSHAGLRLMKPFSCVFVGKSVRFGHWGYPLPTLEPTLLPPIGKIIFEQLDMEVLYDPNAKTAIVSYVYYRIKEAMRHYVL